GAGPSGVLVGLPPVTVAPAVECAGTPSAGESGSAATTGPPAQDPSARRMAAVGRVRRGRPLARAAGWPRRTRPTAAIRRADGSWAGGPVVAALPDSPADGVPAHSTAGATVTGGRPTSTPDGPA